MTNDEIITTAVLHGCPEVFQSANFRWYFRGVGLGYKVHDYIRFKEGQHTMVGRTTRIEAYRAYCECFRLLPEVTDAAS